uniref:DUF3800 domain-containing protein n=1 Tax=Candidatus Kentrum sp. FM TaxID=2126340 RepID=A0A450VMI2_9GAMM|nr:MAG: Protein of unknown function (DUF3800) [Candidatus Kentron sp. FM]VFJ43965.1 MAG: Protein of unknown function (DUF3800) [Candidatus Kentron sp. FM]VFK06018.1 MAG: Protein of unknown function (DUF3800) [Candidatus Kentron sp. FM]
MNPSFVVYIDESGDEGFVFHKDGSGSSRWFVLSAVVVRHRDDFEMISCLKEVREVLGKPPKTPLHFVDLKHEQRVAYVRRVADRPIRTVNVLIYKPLIREPEKFQSTKHLLYRYATRLLLERVSWFCRDKRRSGEGNGFARIIFSNRSNMSYEDIREYLRLLARQSELDSQRARIDFSTINPALIRSVEHSKLAGLQAADAVASGIHFAVRLNRYRDTEPAYLRHLEKTLYRHKGRVMGYGLKVWPENYDAIKAKAPEIENLGGLG